MTVTSNGSTGSSSTDTGDDSVATFLDVPSGNGNGNGNNHSDDEDGRPQQQRRQPDDRTTLHLRWTNLAKSVDIKDDAAAKMPEGGKSGSIHPTATKKSNKVILDRVSGEALPGEILALMGPSGSGKTSLMNVLCGRAAYQDGSITINGTALDKAGMKKLMSKVAYVKQQDVFFETLTVRDQLTYTARLRISDVNTTKEARNAKITSEVDEILRLLQLAKVADSPIMMCSGGEKKRVNIGTELLTNPSIILLDEPTSGLDSASAVSLLGVLRDLAKNHGKTIVTSIHQPNSATFLNTFDKLLMLSDGKAVYFGTPTDSLRYLKTAELPCPEGYNAADHWMDLLVAAGPTMAVDDSRRSATSTPSQLQAAWDNDAVASRLREAGEVQRGLSKAAATTTTAAPLAAEETVARSGGDGKYATGWMTQYLTLTHRAVRKNKITVFSTVNITKTLSIGIVVGLVYLNNTYTERDLFNIYAYFFFVMLHWVMDGMFTALFSFPAERVVVLKERATASYRLSAYYLATTTADLPVFLFTPFLFLLVSYWMAVPTLGFATFVAMLVIALLSVVTGQGLGQLVGAAFDDVQIGQAVATVAILFLMLLGGFFANNLPVWLSWIRYLSPFAYASNAALGMIFSEPVPCDGSGALGALCPADGVGFADPTAVRESFSVYGTVPSNIACLVAACIIPRLGAYYCLRRKKAGERE